jgi:uncharacterized protein YlxW (UPF0749 family)
MKFALSLILLITLVPAFTSAGAAQSKSGAAQSAEDLRAQLVEVQARETELQGRERQLDEDLKSENIERALAGIGSTKPEELRELRRRQLTIETDSVRAQLKILATSRERLEASLQTAKTRAYQQSAEGIAPALNQVLAAQSGGNRIWRMGILAGLIAVLGIVFVIAGMKRAKTR